MTVILVLNSGSSSIKYQLSNVESEVVLAKGIVDRAGTDRASIHHEGPDGEYVAHLTIANHRAGVDAILGVCNRRGPRLDDLPIAAVGHRVVHGGERFVEPTVIDDEVVAAIEDLIPLAPLHNPGNLAGIRGAMEALPGVPHVAVFDTAFHQTMPPSAYTYAIDADLAQRHRIRRYGFHGTSHKYVAEQAAAFLGIEFARFNVISLHIGNGVSACAIREGKSVDTSMGMTPLEGLVMGTRSGDIDPGVIFHLHRQAGMTVDGIDTLLNRESGLLGLAGSSDMRDVQSMVERQDPRALLAMDVYCRRLRHYVAAYVTELDPLHALIFTAGVGENSTSVRSGVIRGMSRLGMELCADLNNEVESGVRRISTDASPVAVLVAPTNEELEIARQTLLTVA